MGTGTSGPLSRRRLVARAAVCWLVSYLVITVVNGLLTLGLGATLLPSLGSTAFDVAYAWTVPVHLVVGVVVWVVSGLRLWRGIADRWQTRPIAAAVAGGWVALAVLVDAVVFVGLLAGTPAGAPADTFYRENQPWTTLYYVAVLVGPLLALALLRQRRAG